MPPFAGGFGVKSRNDRGPLGLVKTEDGVDVKRAILACDHTTRERSKHRSYDHTSNTAMFTFHCGVLEFRLRPARR